MNSSVASILTIGFVAVVFGVVFWLTYQQRKRAGINMRRLATAFGMQFEGPAAGSFIGAPRAFGELRGKRVDLFPFSTGSDKSRISWCAVSATVPVGGSLTFHLRR